MAVAKAVSSASKGTGPTASNWACMARDRGRFSVRLDTAENTREVTVVPDISAAPSAILRTRSTSDDRPARSGLRISWRTVALAWTTLGAMPPASR